MFIYSYNVYIARQGNRQINVIIKRNSTFCNKAVCCNKLLQQKFCYNKL